MHDTFLPAYKILLLTKTHSFSEQLTVKSEHINLHQSLQTNGNFYFLEDLDQWLLTGSLQKPSGS
jgi:hypothetical protein